MGSGISGEHRFDFPLSESDPPPPQTGEDPYIGTIFGRRYRILQKLAEGAQARVYLARHLLIKRHVAIKVILPLLATDQAIVTRFLNEGRAAGTLGHPNIVESLDMGFAPDGAPFLVMELLEGKTLAEEIGLMGPFLVGRAGYIAAQIASAVGAAHTRNIIHRDLKPENVFLLERGGKPDHVKVLDFGISKFTGTRVTTKKGQFLGTPDFMAPEQIENPATVDARADVYALGTMLYAMLAGEAPFAAIEFPKVLRVIVEEEPRKLSDIRPELPPDLVRVIARAMSKTREARFQTMQELEEALLPFALEPRRPGGGGRASVTNELAAVPIPAAAMESVPEIPTVPRLPEPPPTPVPAVAAPPPQQQQPPRQQPPAMLAAPIGVAPPKSSSKAPIAIVASAAVLLLAMGALLLVARSHRAAKRDAPIATATATPAAPADPPIAANTAPTSDVPPTVALPDGTRATTDPVAPATAPRGAIPRGANTWSPAGRATNAATATPDPPSGTATATGTAAPTTAATPTATPPVTATATTPPTATATVAPAVTGPAPGTIEPRAINATVRAHAAEIRGCFDRARMYNADLKGKVTVRASVAVDGQVSAAGVASSTAADARLESCVAAAFRSWQFPPPAGGVAGSVTYTFVFE